MRKASGVRLSAFPCNSCRSGRSCGSRSSSFNFVTGVPNNNIDPTSWAFFQSFTRGAGHCQAFQFYSCFTAGDYIRPVMNNFTGAFSAPSVDILSQL